MYEYATVQTLETGGLHGHFSRGNVEMQSKAITKNPMLQLPEETLQMWLHPFVVLSVFYICQVVTLVTR